MIQRMIGAALFNADTYEEIEADPGAIGQAILVVLLVTLRRRRRGYRRPVGRRLRAQNIAGRDCRPGVWHRALGDLVIRAQPGGRDDAAHREHPYQLAEIGRVVGFAYTPGILSIFSFVPFIGWLFPLVAWLWTLAAVTVAVRQAPGLRVDGSRNRSCAGRRRDRFHPVDHNRDRPGDAAVTLRRTHPNPSGRLSGRP